MAACLPHLEDSEPVRLASNLGLASLPVRKSIRRRFAAASGAGSRIAFHCASLRSRLPGKEWRRDSYSSLPLLSRAHAAKAECDPGPSATSCREAAHRSFVFRSGLFSGLRHPHISALRISPRSRSEWRGGPTRAKPERGGGCFPEALPR